MFVCILLLFGFSMFLCVPPRPYTIYISYPMTRYSLFVLKVSLNTNKPNKPTNVQQQDVCLSIAAVRLCSRMVAVFIWTTEGPGFNFKSWFGHLSRVGIAIGLISWTDMTRAPCGLRGCKNGPTLFPGQMSYKATKPGLVCLSYLSMLYYCIVVY